MNAAPGPRGMRLLRWSVVFAGGFLCGVLVHYGLHRFLLTLEPFIYISF